MESAGFACYSDASSTWRKSAEDGEGVRGKLIFAVSSLTRLLGDEQLQKKGEVFSHLRHITDLCNSLPEETGTGEPLQLKDSSSGVPKTSSLKQNALQGNCDKTLSTCDVDSEDNQEKRSSGVYDFTPKSKKEKQRKENLGRVP